jgi:malate dehydrogenase (quinone)
MEFTEDHLELREWLPLMMNNRKADEKLAATRMEIGTDVNFGALTRCMFQALETKPGVSIQFNREVRKLRRTADGRWSVKLKDVTTGEREKVKAKFVFIGAGGGSLRLLEKSGIQEGRGYGGFPVSGQWLKCTNETIIQRHNAKAYGKASVGAPPMSVPHLDTRMINGSKALLFGPFAGFSTKFLKEGSYFDLFKSIQADNIVPMLAAGLGNIPLTKYLIDQVRQTPEDRIEALREFIPDARIEDWELEVAGQRVQVIKRDKQNIGVLEFGTEVISSADGTLAALLGASPGASTAVSIMLTLLQKCFPYLLESNDVARKLIDIIPSYGKSLAQDRKLLKEIREMTSNMLGLEAENVTRKQG